MGGFHFHVEFVGGPGCIFHRTVILMLQSDTLWFLPPLGESLINPKADTLPGYVAFAYGQAAYAPPDYSSENAPVLVPKPHIFLEAHMRLVARDDRSEKGVEDRLYIHGEIRGTVDKWDYINLDLLPQPFKAYYEAWKSGKLHMSEYIVGLKRTLGVPVDPADYGLDPEKYGF